MPRISPVMHTHIPTPTHSSLKCQVYIIHSHSLTLAPRFLCSAIEVCRDRALRYNQVRVGSQSTPRHSSIVHWVRALLPPPSLSVVKLPFFWGGAAMRHTILSLCASFESIFPSSCVRPRREPYRVDSPFAFTLSHVFMIRPQASIPASSLSPICFTPCFFLFPFFG